ncbi:hypothetical protein [Lewinella cohaerens]|uniref:hypothetical protein n=1 Tax=Lewinella cohaerens TaxID=70995 RepID=UPI00037F5F10|nr:hypothetical protein [Lewinella cohaerens]
MLILQVFYTPGSTLRSRLSLIAFFLVFLGNAQPQQSPLEHCFEPTPTETLTGTSLCAENGEFEPDFIIGTNTG